MDTSNIQELPKSMKNLWTLLSGSLNLKSLQFIADELEQNQKHLIDGILFYKRHDAEVDSLLKITAMKNTAIKPHVLYNMSVFLDLNAQQCCDLFQSYLLYEYKGTPEMAKIMFTNEKQMKNLFENLWNYYYSERIFSLFCLKQILSNWKTSEHIYGKIFQDFLKHINTDGQISLKLIDQLKYLLQYHYEPRSRFVQFLNEKNFNNLTTNILKEQIEILQLLLLYYKNFEPTPKNVLELLRIFSVAGFETNYCSNTKNLKVFCGFLKTMLIVEFFDPNNLYKCQLDGIEHYLFKEENFEIIKQMNLIIIDLNTTVQEHSLIFFSWMIVNLYANFDVEDEDSVERLGNNALQLKIFKYIEFCLSLEQMDLLKESFVYNLIYEIIGNLLAVTFTVFDFEKLIHNEPALNNLLILLFSNDIIAKILFESSLHTGLGLSFCHALNLFPFKTHLLLSFLNSLAQTNMCRTLFEQLSIIDILTSYTEPFDPSLGTYSLLDNETFVLIHDKHLYNHPKLFIPKGTKGNLLYHESSRLIKWNNVVISGWDIFYNRLKFLIHQIKQGHMYSTINDEVVLHEISKISFICSELLIHNSHSNIPHFKNIVKLLLELFQLVVSVNHASIRLFMAGIIKLCYTIMRQNYIDSQQIWFLLHEKRFFPYMIGFSNQFNEILTGTDTNISTLGYILASDEFIKGNYELTFSFLSLISHLVKKGEYLNESSTIASFIFIINDIFSSYKLWNYKREKDSHRIGRMCIDIFYYLINRVRKKTVSELIEIEKICIIRLMEGNAAEQLLSIIKHGEHIVKMKIINSGNECLLIQDDQIVSIRTSLLILSYLLEVYSEVTKLSSLKNKSVIEKIIFSSTNNSNPNMLLIFTHFVCQKYDIYLAINAIQLLNQLAYKFPMSMLACFGSNTEFIRDHFLFRLETVTEDINFKIALLNFLSTCVEYQPGLLEMFLNVNNNQQTSVLNSIIEILEEKLDGQYHCPFELHHASLQFVAKFWLKPNIIAMNKLKKNEKFWKLVGLPLFTEDSNNYENSLCSFVLKILSREIHYSKMLEKTDLNKNFEHLLEEMSNKDVFICLSSHINKTLINFSSWNDDFINFVDGWRDFLSAWSKFIPIQKSSLISTLINDILGNILILISNENSITQTQNKLMNKFSNLLLIITSNDQQFENVLLQQNEHFLETLVEIFKRIAHNKEMISFNSQISLGVFLIKLIRLHESDFNDQELFHSVADLLNNLFKLIAKQLDAEKQSNLNLEKRLIIVNLSIIISMLQKSQKDEEFRYMKILRCFGISEQILNLLIYFLRNEIHLDLAQNISSYFVILTHYLDGADLLNNLNLVNQISINFRFPSEAFTGKMENMNLNHTISIFSHLIRTVNNMIIHLKHHFTESCVSFVAVYMDVFKEIFTLFQKCPKIKIARLVLLILELCSSLSKYVRIWNTHHTISLQMLTHEILLSSNMMVAFILRPSIIIKTFEDEIDTKENFKHSICDNFQNLILQMLLNSTKFLLDVSPDLMELFENETLPNEKYNLLISTNISIPNVDSTEILTFGSLISLINFLIKIIYKHEKDVMVQMKKNTSDEMINKQLSVLLLELSFIFFFIQILIAKSSPKIIQIDKQVFFHEITNEVNTFKTNLISKPHHHHHPRRQNSTSSTSAKVSSINLLERPFIKLILNLLENVLQ